MINEKNPINCDTRFGLDELQPRQTHNILEGISNHEENIYGFLRQILSILSSINNKLETLEKK